MSTEQGRLLVLVDRDGVISRNRSDYVKSWEEFEFLPGALAALRLLTESGARVAVITNQSAVGRGLLLPAELERIHDRMREEVEAGGGRIDAILHCPHLPGENCTCRKPQPGLILSALEQFEEDCSLRFFIGDSHEDLLAARAAGVPFVLVLTGRWRESISHRGNVHSASWVASDLDAAVRWVLRQADQQGKEVAA